MGMFDTVWVRCPWCNEQNNIQSKSGPCTLFDYDLFDAPAAVMAGVDSRSHCSHCGKEFVIEEVVRPQYQIRKVEGDEDDDAQ